LYTDPAAMAGFLFVLLAPCATLLVTQCTTGPVRAPFAFLSFTCALPAGVYERMLRYA